MLPAEADSGEHLDGVDGSVGVVGIVAEFVHEEGIVEVEGAGAEDGLLIDGGSPHRTIR